VEGWTTFGTPLGWIALGWTATGIRTLRLAGPARPEVPSGGVPAWVGAAVAALEDHLAGRPADLAAIPLDLGGLPPFQRRCLEVLRGTAPGTTLTYGELAARAGSPRASRAAGQAMARNPLPILVPCHRVVAADGPGGFSLFGNLETKARLMALEGQ
jgi:methylated-DNA-[protein]-cysteine S-methyltransferase